jgi:hypothetical protein
MATCINIRGTISKTKLQEFISIQLCTKFVPFKLKNYIKKSLFESQYVG